MARDEERQEPDPERQEPASPPPGEEHGAEEPTSIPDSSGEGPLQAESGETPPGEPESPQPETAGASEGNLAADTGNPTVAKRNPSPKSKPRGTGLLWVVLLAVLAAGGYGAWKGLGLFQQQSGDMGRMKAELARLESDIQELRGLAKQLPQENAAKLEKLARRFEESQSHLARVTEQQRQTLESLRHEVDDLRQKVQTGTISLRPTEETSAGEEVPEESAGTSGEATAPAGENSGEPEPEAEEPPPTAPEEETAEETPPGEAGEEPAQPEPEITAESSEEPPAEEGVSTGEPPAEEEAAQPETEMVQEPEPQSESTPPVETATAQPQPEPSKLPGPEPSPEPETRSGPKRSEGAQKFINIVEDSAVKTWGWIKEGSKKLWNAVTDLF